MVGYYAKTYRNSRLYTTFSNYDQWDDDINLVCFMAGQVAIIETNTTTPKVFIITTLEENVSIYNVVKFIRCL